MEKKNRELNLLELIPVRNIQWKTDDQGKVIILKPKFKNPFLVKHILPRMKRPFYKIKLDEMGSFFWKNCDGEKTIREIAHQHKEKFGEKTEPVLDRISLFVQSLDRNNFITFK
jgi:hypothetical protein